MNKRLRNCPVCNTRLEIRRYQCPSCKTTIDGNFRTSDFAALSLEQQEFTRIFICSQGNIKEVEKQLGISYPTVKNRLNEIRSILCKEYFKAEVESKSEKILSDLEIGKISVSEAIIKLEKES